MSCLWRGLWITMTRTRGLLECRINQLTTPRPPRVLTVRRAKCGGTLSNGNFTAFRRKSRSANQLHSHSMHCGMTRHLTVQWICTTENRKMQNTQTKLQNSPKQNMSLETVLENINSIPQQRSFPLDTILEKKWNGKYLKAIFKYVHIFYKHYR